ncbi:ABCG25 [Scenedesmus sp. PABB004]|nr:ABCG25 [Scenedesmus sp. PABB004]
MRRRRRLVALLLSAVALQLAAAAAAAGTARHPGNAGGGPTRSLQQSLASRASAAGVPTGLTAAFAGLASGVRAPGAAGGGANRSASGGPNATALACPPPDARLSAAGCIPSAAAAIVAAGWAQRAVGGGAVNFTVGEMGSADAPFGICVPCQLGEFCPEGTQEESWLSLSTCQLSPQAFTPDAGGGGGAALCKGFKACPEGSFCPNASHAQPCEPGRWCPEGSVASESCNLTSVLAWNPFRMVRTEPQALLERLASSNQPLAGNSCPANSSNPIGGCPAGSYCPSSAHVEPCPPGYYCPGFTAAPIRCPALSSCYARGAAAPNWSWLGLGLMLLLLLLLLAGLEYVRVVGRRDRMGTAHEDEVMQLLKAVGFQMVGTGEDMAVVKRAKKEPAKARSFARSLSSGLKRITSGGGRGGDDAGAPGSRSFVRSLSSGLKRIASGTRGGDASAPGGHGKPPGVPGPVAEGREAHADVELGGAGGGPDTLRRGSGAGGAGGDQAALSPVGSTSGRWSVDAGGDGADGTQRARSARWARLGSRTASLGGSRREAGGSGGGGVVAGDGDEGSQYQVNPRLTLVFSDVWVADRSMQQSALSRAAGRLRGRGGDKAADGGAKGADGSAKGADGGAKAAAGGAASANGSANGSGHARHHQGSHHHGGHHHAAATTATAATAGHHRHHGHRHHFHLHHRHFHLHLHRRGGRHPGAPAGGVVDAAQRARDAALDAAAAAGAKFIVPGVSGRFAHSSLHAIMGPSGCGKTSLCKALAGRLPMERIVGDIRMRCSSAADGFGSESEVAVTGLASGVVANLAYMTGFVPQFDLLHESLTVSENLEVAARLRLPSDAGLPPAAQHGAGHRCSAGDGAAAVLDAAAHGDAHGAHHVHEHDFGHGHHREHVVAVAAAKVKRLREREVRSVVDEVISLMALEKIMHSVVGSTESRKISGGQRKRVAIGVELVARPCLLFLDEPTSGLDAAVAADVVDALKASSGRGMNVLAVMHQPRCSIFNTFDSCFLLSGGGHVVYAGPQRLAGAFLDFLGFHSPPGENAADFLLDVITGTVRRPGDPDYIPSQLALLWNKCGAIWIASQLRKERAAAAGGGAGTVAAPAGGGALASAPSLPAPGGEGGPTSGPLSGPLPAGGAPAAAACDWPWRPRELEALLSRFNLLVDAKRASHGAAGPGSHHHGGADEHDDVLSYEGFLGFWEHSGLNHMLSEAQYAAFIAGVCDDFGVHPGTHISQAEFMGVIKAQMRAAAGLPPVPEATPEPAAPAPGGAQAGARGAGGAPPEAGGALRAASLDEEASPFAAAAPPAGGDAAGGQQSAALQRFRMAGRAVIEQLGGSVRDGGPGSATPGGAAGGGWSAFLASAHLGATPKDRTMGALMDLLLHEHKDELEQGEPGAPLHAADAAASAAPAAAAGAAAGAPAAPGGAAATAAAAAAAAAVSSRSLPGLWYQLGVVVRRSGRKWVSARTALMTDLVLTAFLGLALGAAQGRTNRPADSVLWLLIMLLAFGCMTLARSIHTFGEERFLYLQQESQAGVSVTAWVVGHMLFDVVGLLLHPALFFAWLYVVTLSPVPPLTYYSTIVVVGWYASGMGYLVSLACAPKNALIAGLAAALLLGGVANGVKPELWRLPAYHPLTWLDQLSYTRWGLQALYVAWLTPAPAEQAPATAAFLASLGFCGLDPALLQSLQASTEPTDTASLSDSNGGSGNGTSGLENTAQWWRLSSADRSTAMAAAARRAHASAKGEARTTAAAAAAMTQLWDYYNHPANLANDCRSAELLAYGVLVALGLGCRVGVWCLVKWKVVHKSNQ